MKKTAARLDRVEVVLHRLGIHREIEDMLCRQFGVLLKDVVSRSRGRRHVAEARHEVMHVLRSRFHWSYPAIGDLLGRDHTSVMHALQKREMRMDRARPREEEEPCKRT